jgi:P27 family predicted phage terminase small subunit
MVGRKKMSTAVHEQRGTFKKDPQRKNVREPEIVLGVPPVPDSIDGDEIAVSKWFHVTGLLADMRVMTVSDADLVESYCLIYSRFRKALDSVRKDGIVIQVLTQAGVKPTRNPAALEMHACMGEMLRQLAEMGLTPASRSKLHAKPKEEEADPFQQLLEKMGGVG